MPFTPCGKGWYGVMADLKRGDPLKHLAPGVPEGSRLEKVCTAHPTYQEKPDLKMGKKTRTPHKEQRVKTRQKSGRWC